MLSSFRDVEEWQQPFFGQPALLLRSDDEWVVGGPLEVGPRTWQWVAYSGPSTARRVLATARWKIAPRVLRQRRHGARYLAVPTVTAFARVLPEGWSLAALHDELAGAAEWLRRARAGTDQVPGDQSA